MTYSIDLSHNNSPFDWSKLSPEIDFVILKASQGLTFHDPMLPSYLAKVKELNLKYALYHFLTFGNSGEAQANNFLDYCTDCGIDLNDPNLIMVACDVEDQVPESLNAVIAKDLTGAHQVLKDYLGTVKNKSGLKAFIYSYKGFWVPTFGNPDFSEYPLWVASYQDNAPGMFGGWTTSQLWQFSQNGSHAAPNDGGDVDWSKTMLTTDQIKQLSLA